LKILQGYSSMKRYVMKNFDTTIRGSAIGFLVWFRNQYKIWTDDTYYAIADKYRQCNYGTCRNMILELVKAGYIRIWNEGTRQRRFYIDLKKYNQLVNPQISSSDDSRTQGSEESED